MFLYKRSLIFSEIRLSNKQIMASNWEGCEL